MKNIKAGLIAGGVALALGAAVLIGARVWHSRAVERAYRQGLEEAGAAHQVVEVTEDLRVDAATIREVVAPAAELVAYKYYYTDADVYEKAAHFFGTEVKVPFTTDRTVFTYSGTISAGIDLSEVKIEADSVKKLVRVDLPAPKVLAHQLDLHNFRAYDVTNSIFTQVELSEFAQLQARLMELQESKLSARADFWKDLKDQTRVILSDLITASGAAGDYTVLFYWAEG